jgi:hypothetical protein
VQKPLGEHVARLEERIVILRRKMRDSSVPSYQRNELELELANAEEAVRLFRRAYELEQGLQK